MASAGTDGRGGPPTAVELSPERREQFRAVFEESDPGRRAEKVLALADEVVAETRRLIGDQPAPAEPQALNDQQAQLLHEIESTVSATADQLRPRRSLPRRAAGRLHI